MKIIFLLLSVSLWFSSPAQADSKFSVSHAQHFGLGFVLGNPTALTGKYWLDSERAVDMGIGWGGFSTILVYGDYLLHFPHVFTYNQLVAYVGFGGMILSSQNPPRAKSSTDPGETVLNLNFRVPLGIEWMTPKIPLGVFVELVPGVFVIPGLGPSLQAGLGVRFYF